MVTEPNLNPPAPKAKLLHQEKFIRFSGVMMIVSPFANFILSIAPVQNVGDKTTLPVIWRLATSISWSHWALWGASLLVGLMMLKGRRSSWISVLAILGIFIVFDFWHLKRDMARGMAVPLISIGANIFVFLLVYVQEFRQSSQPRKKSPPVAKDLPIGKTQSVVPMSLASEGPKVFSRLDPIEPPIEKSPPPAKSPTFAKPPAPSNSDIPISQPVQVVAPPASTAAPTTQKETMLPELPNLVGHVIDFDGMGPWARIVNMDSRELYLRGFREPHPEMARRAVEIEIGAQTYRLRMTSRQGPLYTFRFEAVSQKVKLRLVS